MIDRARLSALTVAIRDISVSLGEDADDDTREAVERAQELCAELTACPPGCEACAASPESAPHTLASYGPADREEQRQAALELYGKLLGELYPGLTATGDTLTHAESIVAQIRELRAARAASSQGRLDALVRLATEAYERIAEELPDSEQVTPEWFASERSRLCRTHFGERMAQAAQVWTDDLADTIELDKGLRESIERYLACGNDTLGALNLAAYIGERVAALYAAKKAKSPR